MNPQYKILQTRDIVVRYLYIFNGQINIKEVFN